MTVDDQSAGQAGQVEVGRYKDARATIRDADVVLFQGSTLLSRICSFGTGGEGYSHAGLVYWDADRVRLIHATSEGVHEMPLSEELKTYPGAVELWRLKDEHAPVFDVAGAIEEARKLIGAGYDYSTAILFGIDFLFHDVVGKSLRAGSRSKREVVCSQLVSIAYRRGGKVDLAPRLGDAATSPADLVKGGRIEHVRSFARDDVVDALK